MRLAAGTILFGLLAFAAPASASECVVLLPGMIRTPASMATMEEALVEAGYRTANVGYPSREYPIERLAQMAIGQGLARCRSVTGVDRIHFVTHSLGGILVRQYLDEGEIPELGRVVMLGPPNQGSAAADAMRDMPGYEWLNGPAGAQLGKGDESVPLRLGPADFELGVIAGNRTVDPITSAVLDDPDDGRVSVDDTRLEGMDDHIVIDESHALMMRARTTIRLTLRFLEEGSFGESDSG